MANNVDCEHTHTKAILTASQNWILKFHCALLVAIAQLIGNSREVLIRVSNAK
jgi:hypothetical protein